MNLDPQQRAAVETQSSRALVIAPPGSGKTRVIVERTAYLLEECHVSPYEIVLLTFTRRAAGEMRERLEKRVGKKKVHHLTIGTFHAVALTLLHRFGELIGFRKDNSTVYGEFEESFLLREVAKELGIIKGKTWKIPKSQVNVAFSNYYETGREPDENDPVRPLFLAFIDRCRENNSYTYGSLLTGLKLLLPKISQYLHWKHVIADEQQDNDLLQWELIRTIQQLCGASIFCVADPDQAIFSWRGSCPEYLIEHQHEFDVYRLETNYRSCPEIVDASNRLIGHNERRIDKTMRASRENAGSVEVWKDCDSAKLADISIFTEPKAVARTAILSRIHALLKKLSGELEDRGIPHVYVGRKSALTNSEEFRRFHAFLKLLVNPYDNFSFLLIKDLIGVSAEDYSSIRGLAAKDGMSHLEAWRVYKIDATNHFDMFFSNELSLAGATFNIKYMAIGAAPYPDELGWSFDVEEVFRFVFSWLAQNPNGTIKQYLDWLATHDLQDELSDDHGGLMLMTIHGAKGLEWPNVIIAGANEGIMPSKQAIASGEIEEERRLFYTAMTRAKDSLIITVRPERVESESGEIYENPVSRFVKEVC